MERVTRVKCIVPFILLTVHQHGDCYSCCPSWTKIGDVGRLTDDKSVMDIWNGEKMQYIRQAVLEDRLDKVCDFKYCPHAIKNEYSILETLKNDDPHFNHIIDQIVAGRTIMDKPPSIFSVAHSGRCNLNCIMCKPQMQAEDDSLDERLFTKIIPDILPDIWRLSMAGYGEVLFNQHSRKLLQSMEPERYPSLKIQLLTNGMMFTPKLWETIRHNRFDSIDVSIDAASKGTYEKIRRNGNWDVLRRNLDLISSLRRQNIFNKFAISFVVMKSNYREMKAFMELGLTLGCDKVVFQKVYGNADIRENINLTHNRQIITEIAGYLTDPLFNRPEADTTLIDEYRGYLGQRVSLRDRLLTKSKEWQFYFQR